jgi:tetratricopeptide (TPR) repeat protein
MPALADFPAGAHHAEISAQHLAPGRLRSPAAGAVLHGQARASGDLRFLGYAEAVLTPWVTQAMPAPDALVLWATVQQSRHEFAAALQTLDRSLAVRPDDPQAWLTRATVLRVLGRYPQAADACTRFGQLTDSGIGLICVASIQGVTGQLEHAYRSLTGLSTQGLLDAERAWREAELGEMAVRLGRDADAERWFQQEVAHSPKDFMLRRPTPTFCCASIAMPTRLALLKRQESIEPLLPRIAIAQKRLRIRSRAQ